MQRRKDGHQPGERRAEAQQHHGLDEPEDRYTGDHCPDADAQPAQHQHRKGRRRRTDRNADAFRKAPEALRQLEIPWTLHRIFRVFPEPAVPRIPGTTDARAARHCTQHRRKGKLKANITHGIAVVCRHDDACHRQRGEGIRRAIHPYAQRTDPDCHCGAAYRGCEAGHAHQQKGQQASEHRPASAPAVTLLPLVGQECAEDITAQDGYMHSTHHQHMGKARAPVGAAHGRGKMAAVAHRHGCQHAAGLSIHAAAQGCAEPLLQPVGAGAETAALSQLFEVRSLPIRFCQQHNAVRIQAHPALLCRNGQHKSALHPLSRLTFRQGLAFHPEGGLCTIDLLHPQDCVHNAGIVGGRNAFHLCRQHQRTGGILHTDALQPFFRVQHRCHAHCSTQQNAERRFAGSIKNAQHQTTGNKKCRKRHKKLRLRQKGIH